MATLSSPVKWYSNSCCGYGGLRSFSGDEAGAGVVLFEGEDHPLAAEVQSERGVVGAAHDLAAHGRQSTFDGVEDERRSLAQANADRAVEPGRPTADEEPISRRLGLGQVRERRPGKGRQLVCAARQCHFESRKVGGARRHLLQPRTVLVEPHNVPVDGRSQRQPRRGLAVRHFGPVAGRRRRDAVATARLGQANVGDAELFGQLGERRGPHAFVQLFAGDFH